MPALQPEPRSSTSCSCLGDNCAQHYQQLLGGFPDLQVTIDGELIAEEDLVVARLSLMGTDTGPFAGRSGSGRLVRWSSIRHTA